MIIDLQRVKSRLTTLTVFHNEVTCLDDDRRAGDVHMHFSKASDTVFHNILTYKLTKYGLGKCTERRTENWLNPQDYDQWHKV